MSEPVPGINLPTDVGPLRDLPARIEQTPAGEIAENMMGRIEAWAGSYVVEYWLVWLPFMLALGVLLILLRRIGVMADDMVQTETWQDDILRRQLSMDDAEARRKGIYSRW